MRKITIIIIMLFALVATSTNVFAKGIGLKVGYGWMMQNYADMNYEDQFGFGLYFDLGSFLIDKLIFRPSIDYIALETKHWEYANVWGIHLDWYWFFMSGAKVKPFLGFGPSLNLYDFHHHREGGGDSNAGLELFGGGEFDIKPVSLMLELRYCFNDIATLDDNVFKLNIGAMYNF